MTPMSPAALIDSDDGLAICCDWLLVLWGCSSVGEHLLCTQGVTGSSPVSSTNVSNKTP